MAKGVRTSKERFTFRATLAEKPMPAEEFAAAERMLARLIARAYAADHPKLFHPAVTPSESRQSSGPPAAAAAVGSAPLPSAGGPEKLELEQHENVSSNRE